jgi:hypothetical protein
MRNVTYRACALKNEIYPGERGALAQDR